MTIRMMPPGKILQWRRPTGTGLSLLPQGDFPFWENALQSAPFGDQEKPDVLRSFTLTGIAQLDCRSSRTRLRLRGARPITEFLCGKADHASVRGRRGRRL